MNADHPSHVVVDSPNAPRPVGDILDLAEALARIQINYEREGSGPGTRFAGRLLEDVQAEYAFRVILGPVMRWAMRNETAGVPLDWAALGEILRPIQERRDV